MGAQAAHGSMAGPAPVRWAGGRATNRRLPTQCVSGTQLCLLHDCALSPAHACSLPVHLHQGGSGRGHGVVVEAPVREEPQGARSGGGQEQSSAHPAPCMHEVWLELDGRSGPHEGPEGSAAVEAPCGAGRRSPTRGRRRPRKEPPRSARRIHSAPPTQPHGLRAAAAWRTLRTLQPQVSLAGGWTRLPRAARS